MKGIRHKKKQLTPEQTARKQKRDAFCNRYAVPLQFAASVVLYFLIEAMARHSFADAWTFVDQRTKVFFYNAYLIFVTTLVVFFFRRRKFLRILIFTIWFGLGAANGIILANRVTPLTGPDFGMFSELRGVANKYFNKAEIVLVIAGIIALIVLAVRMYFKTEKYQGKRHWKVIIPGVIAAWAALFGLTHYMLAARQLSNYFSNIAFAYLDYGFPYSLSVTIFDTGVSEPTNYSQKLVDSIVKEEGKPKKTTVTEAKEPNVIICQLESFFDPTEVKWLKFSQDPLPNWHRLSKSCSHGLYRVPTVGAGTVNTEFETLTGMSLRFFGPGEYPYKGILREHTCESVATTLTGLGYTAHAIHDNTATFYGRNVVYSYLGFNTFTSAEYMDTQNDVNENDWMRDRNLIGPINDALNSTKNRDFIYTVSVQPHGAYPTEPVISNPKITVSGAATAEKNYAWEYYVNQIYEEDQFVADLIKDVSKRDEPTVLMFYGDHLPTMGLKNSDLTTNTIFDTNYLIWDNIGLKKQTGTVIAYQAAAKLLNQIGIHDGTMFRFQQTMTHKESYLYDMQTLMYDILYGKQYVYGRTNPYSQSHLAMGVKPITVTKISKTDGDGNWYVEGKNFTQSCKLQVNNKIKDTTFIDNTRLLVRDTKLEKGDWVNVAVQANSDGHEILSTSNTLVYGVGRLADQSASVPDETESKD